MTMTSLYHATTPEVAAIILREGFRDHAATVQHWMFGGDPETFRPRVWFGDMPVIHLAGEDAGYFDGRADEAWIRIEVPDDHARFLAMLEIDDWTWSGRQWLMPASLANEFPRVEMPLRDVLVYRMRTPDQYGEHLSAEFLHQQIDRDMAGTIKERWLDALAAAESIVAPGMVIAVEAA